MLDRLQRLRGTMTTAVRRPSGPTAALTNDEFVTTAYRMILGREPDPGGLETYGGMLRDGVTRHDVVDRLVSSDEYQQSRSGGGGALDRLHASRVQWTRALPKADVIVDLGGASTTSAHGAMIALGYPYHFESLTIIDLPPEERHEEFRSERWPDHVQTEHGSVHYVHASMTDLSSIPDASVDLVNSGQTFEHIYPEEGALLLKEARRVLKPTGHIALDTPNRALTEIQLRDDADEFINPDHKVEYTHAQMMALFDQNGFDVVRAQGLAYMPASASTGEFDLAEMVANPGVYDDIANCYLLAYLARPRP